MNTVEKFLKFIENKILFLRRKDNFIKVIFFLLLTSVALIKLPLFYFGYQNMLFSSFTLGKILIIIAFFLCLIFKNNTNLLIERKKSFFTLLLIFFISSTFSIIEAIDIFFFIKRYHNLFLAIILFITTYFLISSIKRDFLLILENFILSLGLIILILEFFFFLFPYQFIDFLKSFIHINILNSYLMNIDRGRYTLELNLEFFLPFFLYKSLNNKKKSINLIFSLVIIFLSFISNFRTKVVMSFFVILVFLIIFRKKLNNYIKITVFPIISLFIFLGLIISQLNFKFNVFDRFANFEDINLNSLFLNYRIYSAIKSFELFLSSPFLGVGLGSFYFYNDYPNFAKFSLLSKNYQINYNDLVKFSPHNIFFEIASESGIFAIVSFIAMSLYFLIQDIKVIKKKNKNLPYVISSWVCFIYFLLNPAYSLFSIGWFWFIRGLLLKF